MSTSHFSRFLHKVYQQQTGHQPNPNPLFNNGRGFSATLQLTPPFAFRGVTLRTFPLRADRIQLQRFVDRYLYNDRPGVRGIPSQTGYFRVFLPYIYLMVVNYGRMSVEAANLGWIAQREVAFSIPLLWLKENRRGKLEFYDWAYVSPFIYVDNELSMTTGREVYGWPKTMAQFDPRVDAWMDDPRHRDQVCSVSTMVFPEQYAGRKQEPRVLMEIDRAEGPHLTSIPPDAHDLLNPFQASAIATINAQAMMLDTREILQGMGITRQQPGTDPLSYLGMAKRIGTNFNPYNPNLYFNTLNLKQFRDAESPVAACYQAITNATMVVDRFNGAALLGDTRMLMGDPTGGYRVKMHCYNSQPIVDTLGLKVAERNDNGDVSVATLEPFYPFWLDIDMTYNLAEVLNWRTKHSEWQAGRAPLNPEAATRLPPAEGKAFVPRLNFYNTQLNAATQEISGPFSFPNTTMRVLPLLAREEALDELVDEYLNTPLRAEDTRFERWGNYVYLVASNHEGMTSHTNNVGFWAEREVTFYVAVKRYEKGAFHSAALVPMYAYANSTTAAITGSEVSGIPTLRSDLVSPPTEWMNESGPAPDDQSLLIVRADVLPVLGLGQGAERRDLVEVREGLPLDYNDTVSWRFVANRWGGELHEEHERKLALARGSRVPIDELKSQAMALLAGELPLNILSFKQFRDASAPLRACYQSLVQTQRTIDKVFDIREIESRCHVLIHDYPSQPLIRKLGLIPKTTHDRDGNNVYTFEPLRPFWLQVAMHEELGTRLFSRAGTTRWTRHEQASASRAPAAAADVQAADPTAVTFLELRAPQRLRDRLTQWRRDEMRSPGEPSDAPVVTQQQQYPAPARTHADGTAVEEFIDIDPQVAIDSLLSNEWEHWGAPRWWESVQILRENVVDGTADALPDDVAQRTVEILHVELARALQRAPRPEVITSANTTAALHSIEELTRELDELEQRHRAIGALREVMRLLQESPPEALGAEILASDGSPLEVLLTSEHGVAIRRAAAAMELLGSGGLAAVDKLRKTMSEAVTHQWQPQRFADAVLEQVSAAAHHLQLHDGDADGFSANTYSPAAQMARYEHSTVTAKERVRDTKARLRMETDALLVILAKAYQKPEFVLRRDSVGTESNTEFPPHKCWKEWYVGCRDE